MMLQDDPEFKAWKNRMTFWIYLVFTAVVVMFALLVLENA